MKNVQGFLQGFLQGILQDKFRILLKGSQPIEIINPIQFQIY